jgi:hypothetical protein
MLRHSIVFPALGAVIAVTEYLAHSLQPDAEPDSWRNMTLTVAP